MRQLEIENQLRDIVSRIILQVELATSQGRTDINLALEDAFIPILRSVYNLPHLVNLNRKQKNFPGIDLGDDHDRVAFQLTSTTTLDKVKSTVRQFMERGYYNTFDELYVLMLTPKQTSWPELTNGPFLSHSRTKCEHSGCFPARTWPGPKEEPSERDGRFCSLFSRCCVPSRRADRLFAMPRKPRPDFHLRIGSRGFRRGPG